MSKKLKLTALKTSTSLRSSQRMNSRTLLQNSPYFSQQNDHSSKIKNVNNDKCKEIEKKMNEEGRTSKDIKESEKGQKKRVRKKQNVPIKIEYEESNEVKPQIKSDDTVPIVEVNTKENIIENRIMKNEETEDDASSAWEPSNWKRILENIQEMRKHKTAPVDEMGCHKCADPDANDSTYRYQCLIALMLSSQTKDQITHAAMKRLVTYGCIPSTIMATPNDVLIKLIQPVGFANKKADYLKRTSSILLDKYNGDIPKTIKELCDLPGVGPKMAHICMQIAWGEVSGIGVDTHVHRICNRLNWVKKPTKTPEETRKQVEEWLPKEFWNEINHLLVGFGQEICLPRFPKCKDCLNKDICPFAKAK
ncbi:PREDICTED: endonuclease III-like protein 1 [Polistes dominula]|uniref:Endonuclease III homolog n=1 Tax=Polistes dominula TaxID=743375 RepID=A0ABM1IWY7_POLDO|nr:PREDICTED: endonuclease III-like protein 1 [Polistes dominula]